MPPERAGQTAFGGKRRWKWRRGWTVSAAVVSGKGGLSDGRDSVGRETSVLRRMAAGAWSASLVRLWRRRADRFLDDDSTNTPQKGHEDGIFPTPQTPRSSGFPKALQSKYQPTPSGFFPRQEESARRWSNTRSIPPAGSSHRGRQAAPARSKRPGGALSAGSRKDRSAKNRRITSCLNSNSTPSY